MLRGIFFYIFNLMKWHEIIILTTVIAAIVYYCIRIKAYWKNKNNQQVSKMTKGEDKRQRIFDKYKNNLNLLVNNAFIKEETDVYICPMCLRKHQTINEKDPLTLEDAPPKSLGGTANTLTCKSCNNTAGYKIDFHLTERLKEIDSKKFTPGTQTEVIVKIGSEVFRGKVIVEADGTLKMYHSKKNNHPEKLEEAMGDLKGGKIIDIEFIKSRVIPENLEYALLKTGYLMAFEKLGYSLILDPCFDIIRQQLQNPEARVYPEGFWFSPHYPPSMAGVYFITDLGLECLVTLFNLKTDSSQRMFGVLLSLPINPINQVIDNLNKKFENEGSEIVLTLYPYEQDDQYLTNIKEIEAMYKWINLTTKNL